ncbi:hypothetical protein [Reinekea sp.]|uniref:hypothetical protein n=1 Tax=Reinekea sp. TaxID=1970455 RepID=UPI002A7FFBCD|nr:hypothetical protein [Reinekea sp.]
MKSLLIVASVLALVACLPTSNNDPVGPVSLAVAAASPDYTTSDVILVNPDPAGDEVIEQRIHTTTPSDIGIAVSLGQLYRLERSNSDSVSKIGINAGVVSVDWQRSVLGDDASANPYDLLALSTSLAYVARFDSNDLWVINPSASIGEDVLIEKIDLSAFANAESGNPRMADLEWVDGKLFVLLTGLEDNWRAAANSKVVVIDTSNNSLVDTNTVIAGVQAIELPVRNAKEFALHNGVLYVAATGDAYNSDTSLIYTGGIATLNVTSYATALLIDDGDLSAAPYGNISGVTVSASNDIYFSGSLSWGNDKVFVQRAGTSTISEIVLGANNYNIGDLIATDDALYVGVHAQTDGSENAGLKVINLDDGAVNRLIELTYNPTQILAL